MHINNLFKTIIVLAIAALMASCNTFNARKAAALNDAVIAGHRELMVSLEAFISALESRNGNEIGKTLEGLKQSAASGAGIIDSENAVACDDEFLPAADRMFTFYADAAADEYAAIAGFYSRDSISYAEYDSLQVLIQQIEDAQHEADKAFLDAQQAFAGNCGFKLVRNVD